MILRIVAGIIGLAVAVFVILQSGILLKLALLAVSLIGLREFYAALKISKKPVCFAGYGAAVYMLLIDKLTATGMIFIISLFTLAVVTLLVIKYREISVYDIAITFFGFFYVCFLLSNMYLVREHYLGIYAVWLILISAWGSDTGAYFTGMTLGSRKLAPKISPKKTVEGAIGGVVCATLLGACFGFISQKYLFNLEAELVLLSVAVVFFGSVFSQLGDLAASAVKRQVGIKDFGDVIPGHGGILDRFDSILFTAPTVYCVLIVFDVLRGIY